MALSTELCFEDELQLLETGGIILVDFTNLLSGIFNQSQTSNRILPGLCLTDACISQLQLMTSKHLTNHITKTTRQEEATGSLQNTRRSS